MPLIDASRLTDDALKDYNEMMVECVITLEKLSVVAMSIWTEVLRELDVRGLVTLTSGSYEDIGNALVQRRW